MSAALLARDTAKGLKMSVNAYLPIIGMPRSTYYWGIKHSRDADPDAPVKAAISKILSDKRTAYTARGASCSPSFRRASG